MHAASRLSESATRASQAGRVHLVSVAEGRQAKIAHLHGEVHLIRFIGWFVVNGLNFELSAELAVEMVQPRSVLLEDAEGCLLAVNLPLAAVLVVTAQLVRDRRDVQVGQDPVVHVAANFLA